MQEAPPRARARTRRRERPRAARPSPRRDRAPDATEPTTRPSAARPTATWTPPAPCDGGPNTPPNGLAPRCPRVQWRQRSRGGPPARFAWHNARGQFPPRAQPASIARSWTNPPRPVTRSLPRHRTPRLQAGWTHPKSGARRAAFGRRTLPRDRRGLPACLAARHTGAGLAEAPDEKETWTCKCGCRWLSLPRCSRARAPS